MKRISTAVTAAALAAALMGCIPAAADAQELTTAGGVVSLPYVEDVNETPRGYTAIVTVCGDSGARLRVTCDGKPVKARKVARRTWAVGMKSGKAYRITARPAHGGEARSIGYAIY